MKIDNKSLQYAKKFLIYKADPCKFIEECVYIPTPGGDELIKLYPPQKKIVNSFLKDHFLILLKSRQLGFSTICQCIITYLSTFYENVIIGIISRDGSESSDFCRKSEDMLDKLPEWLRPTYKTKSVQSFILQNGNQVWSSPISPANPGAVFRGKSITLLIMDEAAHIRYIDEAWTAIAPALSKAQMSAEKASIPFGTIMVSTPNKTEGIGKFFFQNWKAAINADIIFKPHKIHWSEIDDFRNDPTWYKKQCELLNNDKRKIAQELELKFISTENSLFDEKVQEALQNIDNIPKEKIKFPSGTELWRFKDLDKTKFHLIGVDTASNSGADFSAIEVVEHETLDHVLEFKGKLPVKEFAKIVKLCARLIPHNILIVENNSYGNQVIEELQYDEEISYNIFGEWKGEGDKKTFTVGLNTNARTRPLILDAMFTYVNENPEFIKSERLALELLGLSNKRNRIEADAGGNDDLAMSYAFICYARHYCNDLLGNTQQVEVGETIFMDETINMLTGMNQRSTPLHGSFTNDTYVQFKKTLDAYIKENAGVNLRGTVNTFSLWNKQNEDKWNITD